MDDLGNNSSKQYHCHHQLCSQCASDAHSHHWKFFGVGRHIEDSFASFTVHRFLVQFRRLRTSCSAHRKPVFIVRVLKFGRLSADACNILSGLVCGVSLCTITTISVNRFLALHCHMRYPDFTTTKRATYTSATLCLIGLLLPCIYLWSGKFDFFW